MASILHGTNDKLNCGVNRKPFTLSPLIFHARALFIHANDLLNHARDPVTVQRALNTGAVSVECRSER